jgi:hypothetical protein
VSINGLVPLKLKSLEVLDLPPSERGGHQAQTTVVPLIYKDESVKGLREISSQ